MDVASIYVAFPITALPDNSYQVRFLSCKSKNYGIPWTSATYWGNITISNISYKLYSFDATNDSNVYNNWAESDMSPGNSWLHSDTSNVNKSSYTAYQYSDVLVWLYDKTVYQSQKTIYVFSDYEYTPFGTWINHTGNLVGGTTKREFHNKSTSVCVADTINAGYIDENAIRYINLGDGIERPIDAVAVGGKTIESIGTLVTTWSGKCK